VERRNPFSAILPGRFSFDEPQGEGYCFMSLYLVHWFRALRDTLRVPQGHGTLSEFLRRPKAVSKDEDTQIKET
jgi:hypothetical protein